MAKQKPTTEDIDDDESSAAEAPVATATAKSPNEPTLEKLKSLAELDAESDAATRPNRRKRHRDQHEDLPTPPIPMQMRKAGYEYPHIEVQSRVQQNQQVSAMVRVEEHGMLFRLQYTAAENLEPAKPCELIPGTGQLLRMKR